MEERNSTTQIAKILGVNYGTILDRLRESGVEIRNSGFIKRLIIERFLDKVEIDGSEGCWKWTGQFSIWGYGVMQIDKKLWRASRLAYSMFIAEIPEGALICHSCDNRACVNPAHLSLGTHRDSMNDMVDRDRQAKGIEHGCAILTVENVLKIREMRSYGYLLREIAQSFGISRVNVGYICSGDTWKHTYDSDTDYIEYTSQIGCV